MDKKLLESYLETIFGLVIDEEKIVTYKSLSRNLGVHINTAKQLLYAFLVKQKDEGTCPVSATYLLAGKLDDGSLYVTVINESDLKSTSEKFSKVTSQHIYSVQKGNELRDVRVLTGIGKGPQNFRRLSQQPCSNVFIKCSKSCIKHRVEKKGVRITESNTVVLNNVQSKQIKNEGVQKTKKIENEGPGGETESPLKHKKQIIMKSPVKKNSPGDKLNTKSPTKVDLEKKSARSKSIKPRQSITNFFTNAAQKNSELKACAVEKINSVSSNEETINSTVESFDKNKVSVLHEDESQLVTNLKRNKSNDCLKNKRKGSKRKRIQVFSDSEESDCSDALSLTRHPPTVQREEEDDEVKEEEENTTPLSVVLEEEKEDIKDRPQNKHKKRKIVDRTVMNEDGYLETRKEVVFETDSENELDLEAEEKGNSSNQQHKKVKLDEGEEKSKSNPSANASKKQSSLLLFFKKN